MLHRCPYCSSAVVDRVGVSEWNHFIFDFTTSGIELDYKALREYSRLRERLGFHARSREKGAELWRNDPEGAEAIQRFRAAGLSEDERLASHLDLRPGANL